MTMAAIATSLVWAALVVWGFVTAAIVGLLVVCAIADARDRRRARRRRLAEAGSATDPRRTRQLAPQ
jgi:hypothetical protein